MTAEEREKEVQRIMDECSITYERPPSGARGQIVDTSYNPRVTISHPIYKGVTTSCCTTPDAKENEYIARTCFEVYIKTFVV